MSSGSAIVPREAAGELVPARSVSPNRNPAAVYLARLTKGSRRVQRAALEAIATLLLAGATLETFPWHELRYQHTQAVRAQLVDRYSSATGNRFLAALRGVLREAWRLSLVDREAYERAADLEPIRGQRLPAGRCLTGDELTSLFDACGEDLPGRRDAGLLVVLYSAGLRRTEAAALDLGDITKDVEGFGLVTVRRGKGNKSRTVPLSPVPFSILQRWMRARGAQPGPLLCHVSRGGQLRYRRFTGQGIRSVLLRLARAGSVARFSPHDLRRSFITNLLDQGVDLSTVQRLAGHSKVDTTTRYDRRGEEAKRRAVQLLEKR